MRMPTPHFFLKCFVISSIPATTFMTSPRAYLLSAVSILHNQQTRQCVLVLPPSIVVNEYGTLLLTSFSSTPSLSLSLHHCTRYWPSCYLLTDDESTTGSFQHVSRAAFLHLRPSSAANAHAYSSLLLKLLSYLSQCHDHNFDQFTWYPPAHVAHITAASSTSVISRLNTSYRRQKLSLLPTHHCVSQPLVFSTHFKNCTRSQGICYPPDPNAHTAGSLEKVRHFASYLFPPLAARNAQSC